MTCQKDKIYTGCMYCLHDKVHKYEREHENELENKHE